MDNRNIANRLKSICQLDIDAIHAYAQALEHIDQADIKSTIARFQSDHARHVKDLSDMIRSYGQEPPEFSKDFKGFLLQAFAAVRSVSGSEGALKALRGGEKMTNESYGDAVSEAFPPMVLVLLKRNYDDEQRHLSYIDQCLSARTWEKAA
jgi:rubrerythrin